jgi:hypothetical protein
VYVDAAVAIQEVKSFICFLYGSYIRFYNTVLKASELEVMKEDLIEALTATVISSRLSAFLQSFCTVLARPDDAALEQKVARFGSGLRPSQLGLGKLFALDATSGIQQMFNEMVAERYDNSIANLGDVGGSFNASKSLKQKAYRASNTQM